MNASTHQSHIFRTPDLCSDEQEGVDLAWMRRQYSDCIHCGFEDEPKKRGEAGCDINKGLRRGRLLEGIAERQGGERNRRARFSSGLVLEQAADRYFAVLTSVQDSLKGHFTEPEFDVVLNTTCGPVWEWDLSMPVASMVADDNGLGSLGELPEGSFMRTLMSKLIALDDIENAALVDACERVWRGHANPLL